MNKLVAVVDIETTGFQNQGGLIVEVGIVGLNLSTGEVVEEFSSLVKEKGFGEKHTKQPYGWIFQNSTLKPEEVDNAPLWESVKPAIQKVFDKYPLGATAYNKRFDFGFLKSRGLKIKELNCIMLKATPIVNLPSNRGFSTPKWPTVEEAWAYFFPSRPYQEAHRALDDAVHEAQIAYAIKLNEKNKVLQENAQQ